VALKKTPLYARHRASGAKMMSFGGWDMPLEYAGIVDEHLAVRGRAGLFDVSHMGEIEIAGKDALEGVQRISCNDASRLQIGQAQYSGLLTSQGTFLDDLLVYRLAPQHFLLVVNAANIAKDYAWIAEQIASLGDVVAVDASSRYALLAVQGPAALEVLQPLTGVDLQGLLYYRFAHGEVASVRATISRTGYTGEDGFELYCPPGDASKLWFALLDEGKPDGLKPAGLGARDSLRTEMKYALYGNDIDDAHSPLEAGLGWVVKFDKPAFIGKAALERQKAAGVKRKLVGFELVESGIPRHGYPVLQDGKKVGEVTSGTMGPSVKKPIGIGYVPPELAPEGSAFQVEIRGRPVAAKVVKTPFWRP
jgi:aminomethyltransferase